MNLFKIRILDLKWLTKQTRFRLPDLLSCVLDILFKTTLRSKQLLFKIEQSKQIVLTFQNLLPEVTWSWIRHWNARSDYPATSTPSSFPAFRSPTLGPSEIQGFEPENFVGRKDKNRPSMKAGSPWEASPMNGNLKLFFLENCWPFFTFSHRFWFCKYRFKCLYSTLFRLKVTYHYNYCVTKKAI